MNKTNSISLAKILKRDKNALAEALVFLETDPESKTTFQVLAKAYDNCRGHVIGVTGPPGVGKSTLLSELIKKNRELKKTVGVIAVDPSSQSSGGSLLGDRIRLMTDPDDKNIFIRSMAARDHLGGVASITFPSMVVMRAVFDVVFIETVGVGQSETEIEKIVDTVVFCVQPDSGDNIQFMKAGIVEIPDIITVTKSDVGMSAKKTEAEIKNSLRLSKNSQNLNSNWIIPVMLSSSFKGKGLSTLIRLMSKHFVWLKKNNNLLSQRNGQSIKWFKDHVREEYGKEGISKAKKFITNLETNPFVKFHAILKKL